MKPALAPQVLNRVYQAAARLQSANHREAALIGAITASFRDRGRFDLKYVQHHTAASLDWARRMEVEHLRDMEQHLDPTLTANNIATHGTSSGLFGLGNIPDASMPSEREVKAMASRFSIEYRDNGEAGAAA